MDTAAILLENGCFIQAKGFGAPGTKTGEIVFNTSMTGYQEIVTDPSYAGQFVVFSMPEIGVVGTNAQDCESASVFASGVIVSRYSDFKSNYRSERSLGEFLKSKGALGLCGVDTRRLVKMVRDGGSMMMVASTLIHDKARLQEILSAAANIKEINYIKEVSTKTSYTHSSGVWDFAAKAYRRAEKSEKTVLVLDFGVKKNILNSLVSSGLNVEVAPHDYPPAKILELFRAQKINGVFLSNGPGDPMLLKEITDNIRELIRACIPIFGICLGHQLLSIAFGYGTYKMNFGQHGANHPVKNMQNSCVEITAQNHNYCVRKDIEKIAEITHVNLFDGTVEGVRYKDFPVFSVQHHPEASPGTHDSSYIFSQFVRSL